MLKYKHYIKNGIELGFNILFLSFIPLIFLLRYSLRLFGKYRKRSIWTGAPILTMPLHAQCERQLGFNVTTIVRSSYFITQDFDINISHIAKNPVTSILYNYAIFLWMCVTTDRVHAYMDGGILPSKNKFFNKFELYTYYLLNIKLFVWTYGADVRTRNATLKLGNPNCCTECPAIGLHCICQDTLFTKNYERVRKVAIAIFSMGDMIEYTPHAISNLHYWPIDIDKNNKRHYAPNFPDSGSDRPLRIVHAPNHREFKGTKYLEAAVKKLQAHGANIELILVERLQNNEALAIYRTADVIFDQCLIGFHGYFAIEAMALGKPVICYIRNANYLIDPSQCPILNIHRDDLYKTLHALSTCDRKILTEIGKKSRHYVEQYYTLDAFTKRLKKCYEELAVI